MNCIPWFIQYVSRISGFSSKFRIFRLSWKNVNIFLKTKMKCIFGFDQCIWKLLLLSVTIVSIVFLDSFNMSSGFPDSYHYFHYNDMCPKSVPFFNQEISFIWFPWSIGDVQWVFNLECFKYEPILSALNPELLVFQTPKLSIRLVRRWFGTPMRKASRAGITLRDISALRVIFDDSIPHQPYSSVSSLFEVSSFIISGVPEHLKIDLCGVLKPPWHPQTFWDDP